MSDSLSRLAGRTLGLLPVLQPRLLSMFAVEGSVEGGERVESPADSPLDSRPQTPNSGGAGTEARVESRLMPPLYPKRGIEGEGESGAMTDRSTLPITLLIIPPMTQLPRSIVRPAVETAKPIAETVSDLIVSDPVPKVLNQSASIDSTVQRSVQSRVEPSAPSALAHNSGRVEVLLDRPPISVQTVVHSLVPSDRPTLPLTRLPRSLMQSIVETRSERSVNPVVPLASPPGTGIPRSSHPLGSLEREDRREEDLVQDLELVTVQNSISLSSNPSESLMLRERDNRSLKALKLEVLTDSVSLALSPGTGIVLTPLETLKDTVGESIELVQPHPEMNSAGNDQRSQDLELVTLQNLISISPNPSESLIPREQDDRNQQPLALELLTASVPLVPLDTLRDAVGESIGPVQPNPEMNSATNHQNRSKQVENKIIHDPQSVATDLSYEPQNLFRDGLETKQNASPDPGKSPPQPWVNNTPLDQRSQDLALVTLQNAISISPNPSESLIPRKKENQNQPALKLEALTALVPLALPPGTGIAQPTLETLLRNAVGESIGPVQPNPEMNSATNHQNRSKQVENKIIHDPQSVATDLSYEPQNLFRDGLETKQNASPDPGKSPPQPWVNNTPLDQRSQDLALVTLQNAISISPNPSESLIPRKKENQNQPALKLEALTALVPLALPPGTGIAQPTLETLLRNAVGESIGPVQPNPRINDQVNRTNPLNPESQIEFAAEMLDQFKEEILQDLQSISTDLRYEPQNEFRGRSPTQQTAFLAANESPTLLKVPLTKEDLGGTSSPYTTNNLSNLESETLAIRSPTPNSGGAGIVTRNQTTIAITIGRISVRGVQPIASAPSRSTRSTRPQMPLNDYLKTRNGGNG